MNRDEGRTTPLWLSHHWPEDYDRCVRVGRAHVCRRCTVLYPLAFAVLALALLGARFPEAFGIVALVVLPLPALVDFVAEHLGWWAPSPRRLVAVTVPLGVGLGVGFARYLENPADPWFWGVVVCYAAIALLAALTGRRRSGHP
ncbi:MAG: hypothetical protein MUE36_06010 [Acidimicrobiales bacterium]|nr:hypothetical protein [Acidimicrobiales bacterium]